MTRADWLASPFRYDEAWTDYVDVAQPAAGTNASVVVPGEVGWIMRAARATLTTDANAANRVLSVDYVSANGVTRVRNLSAVVVTANTTNQRYELNAAWTVSEHATNAPTVVPLLDLLLPPGWLVRFTIDAVQVGDQLAGLSLVVVKVPTGASYE